MIDESEKLRLRLCRRAEQRKILQQNKLNLQNSIQGNLARAYKTDNTKITHFYNNVGYSGVPIWALFEIMSMGDFGFLLSCLIYDVRDDILRRMGINVSTDTDRKFAIIYAVKPQCKMKSFLSC